MWTDQNSITKKVAGCSSDNRGSRWVRRTATPKSSRVLVGKNFSHYLSYFPDFRMLHSLLLSLITCGSAGQVTKIGGMKSWAWEYLVSAKIKSKKNLLHRKFCCWPSLFPVPKRKSVFSQPQLLFHEILHLREHLVNWLSYFHFGTEQAGRGGGGEKIPCQRQFVKWWRINRLEVFFV